MRESDERMAVLVISINILQNISETALKCLGIDQISSQCFWKFATCHNLHLAAAKGGLELWQFAKAHSVIVLLSKVSRDANLQKKIERSQSQWCGRELASDIQYLKSHRDFFHLLRNKGNRRKFVLIESKFSDQERLKVLGCHYIDYNNTNQVIEELSQYLNKINHGKRAVVECHGSTNTFIRNPSDIAVNGISAISMDHPAIVDDCMALHLPEIHCVDLTKDHGVEEEVQQCVDLVECVIALLEPTCHCPQACDAALFQLIVPTTTSKVVLALDILARECFIDEDKRVAALVYIRQHGINLLDYNQMREDMLSKLNLKDHYWIHSGNICNDFVDIDDDAWSAAVSAEMHSLGALCLTSYCLSHSLSPHLLTKHHVASYAWRNYSLSLNNRGENSATDWGLDPIVFQSHCHLLHYVQTKNWSRQVQTELRVCKTHARLHTKPFSCLQRMKKLMTEVLGDEHIASTTSAANDVIVQRQDDFDIAFPHDRLYFGGLACAWTDEDEANCSLDFRRAQLYHLYPIWPVACGLCAIASLYWQLAKACKESYPQVWASCHALAIQLYELLLQDAEVCGRGSVRSVPGCQTQITHSFRVFMSLRGHCWDRLLAHMRASMTYDRHTIDSMYCRALEDPSLAPEDRISLMDSRANTAQNAYFDDNFYEDFFAEVEENQAAGPLNHDEQQQQHQQHLMSPANAKNRNRTDKKQIVTDLSRYDLQQTAASSRIAWATSHISNDESSRKCRRKIAEGDCIRERVIVAQGVPKKQGCNRLLYTLPDTDTAWPGQTYTIRPADHILSCQLNTLARSREHTYCKDVMTVVAPVYVEQLAMSFYLSELAGRAGEVQIKFRQSPSAAGCMWRRHNGSIVEGRAVHVASSAGGGISAHCAAAAAAADLHDSWLSPVKPGVGIVNRTKMSASKRLKTNQDCVVACDSQAAATVWLSSWCEARIWLAALNVLMYEEVKQHYLNSNSSSQLLQIYADLPFTMSRPYMHEPMDFLPERYNSLGSPAFRCNGFYSRRRHLLQTRLDQLRSMSDELLADYVHKFFDKYKEKKSPCFEIQWDHICIDEVATFIVAVGGRAVAIIFEAVLRHPESYFRGMPDLIFWKVDVNYRMYHSCASQTANEQLPLKTSKHKRSSMAIRLGTIDCSQFQMNSTRTAHTPASSSTRPAAAVEAKSSNINHHQHSASDHSVLAVEVKSVHDQLSKWQMIWLELLVAAGVPVEVLRVQTK